MTLYTAFEGLVIAGLLAVSLRYAWQRVVVPVLRRPKSSCGSCNNCGSSK